MLSMSIFKFVEKLINSVVTFAGLEDFTVDIGNLNDTVYFCFLKVYSVFNQGVSMLSWLFPNQAIYQLCIGLTLDILTASLTFEIIALFLRIYNSVKK